MTPSDQLRPDEDVNVTSTNGSSATAVRLQESAPNEHPEDAHRVAKEASVEKEEEKHSKSTPAEPVTSGDPKGRLEEDQNVKTVN